LFYNNGEYSRRNEMNHREQFHGVGRVLYKGGLCLCLALIGLLLGAHLGVGPSLGATIPEIEAEMRNLEPRLVQVWTNISRLETIRVAAENRAKAGGPNAETEALSARTALFMQQRSREEAEQIRDRHHQLNQRRELLRAAESQPSSKDEAIARNVALQNNLKHNLNFLMKLEAIALNQAQVYKQAGYSQGYIDGMKNKDALTAQIVEFQQKLQAMEVQEQVLRQRKGPKKGSTEEINKMYRELGEYLEKSGSSGGVKR
jgi:hypothetical protein